MTEIIRRYGKGAKGRKLACFAAAFSLMLLSLCLGLRDWQTGAVWLAVTFAVSVIMLIPPKGIKGALGTAALALLAASVLFYFRVYRTYAYASVLDGVKGTFTAEITETPQRNYSSWLLEGRLLSESGAKGQKVNIRISGTDITPQMGDIITVSGRASLKSGKYFNYGAAEGRFTDIKGFSNGTAVSRPDKLPLRYYPKLFAEKVRERISLFLTGDRGGLVTALLTGSKENMSFSFKNNLALSGGSHITAVSGMHVGIIAAAMVYLLGKRYGPAAALPVMIFFGLSTGMNPPVMRSLLMAAISLGAFVLDRENDGLTSAMSALLIILIFEPASIMSVSLQLSFASVMGIILFSDEVFRTLNAYLPLRITDKEIVRYINMSVAVTVSATLAVLPFSAVYFDRVSVISPVTNLLVLWMVPLIMGLGILFLFLSLFWTWGAGIAASILGAAAGIFIKITELMASFRFSSASSGDMVSIAAVAVVSLFLVFGYIVRPGLRKYTVAIIAVIAVLPFASSAFRENSVSDTEVFGSGLTMIRYGHQTAAIVPQSKCYSDIERDYFRCLLDWGRAESDAVIYCGAEPHKNISGDIKTKSLVYPEKYGFDNVKLTEDISVSAFGGRKGFDCIVDAGELKVVWACGNSRAIGGSEKIDADVLVLGGDLAADYFQTHRLFERVRADNAAAWGVAEEDMYPLEQTYRGDIRYLRGHENIGFSLSTR